MACPPAQLFLYLKLNTYFSGADMLRFQGSRFVSSFSHSFRNVSLRSLSTETISTEDIITDTPPSTETLMEERIDETKIGRKLKPRQVVEQLNAYIVGQQGAKKAVAIALRNRWRRQNVSEDLRAEISPKNILMIGPTGCGKTEVIQTIMYI